MSRRGRVRLDGRDVGIIEERPDAIRFTYLPSWLAHPDCVPISQTLPLRGEPYEHRSLPPSFDNLLPEGWLLELSTAKLKIPKDDAFGILLATCAGPPRRRASRALRHRAHRSHRANRLKSGR